MTLAGPLPSLGAGLVERLYGCYFSLVVGFFGKKGTYVFVDIDNTVNTQKDRLLKSVVDGRCDYKRANRFGEVIRDVPLPGASAATLRLARRYAFVWLTSRSLRLFPATYLWLRMNDFAARPVVFTGSTLRKIAFLRMFLREHNVQFIVDDMKEGYEAGSPHYVLAYKEFLENSGVLSFEGLSLAK